ncbi:MAG: DUF4298 domain-containing protein [Ezakiella sp.]|nr:DUF4298 domain-containing protein [Ezakiella sp.]MDD7471682.1 DUF4298 domain-containing protein [Bacillota bacterium]MDY3922862.1 DUF4298 domain-containing protein [Ezakiella sp.]
MDRAQNIREMEKIFDKHNELIKKLSEFLDEFESDLGAYEKLKQYYGSKTWQEDKDDYDKGKYENIKAGVLSEDAIYNLIADNYFLALKLLNLANKVLQDH